MKNKRLTESPAGMVVRLLAAFVLLMVAFGANAATYMQCMQTYQKSLGIPGTPTCAIQVAGTSPMSTGDDDPYNAMNYYNCPNASEWIADYCGGVPVPPQSDDSCPVADPVSPAKASSCFPNLTSRAATRFHSSLNAPIFLSPTTPRRQRWAATGSTTGSEDLICLGPTRACLTLLLIVAINKL
jgi:hypothetical protein